ncbi:MAG: hypothetical protein FWE60_02995 [Oscillospiraceae bacterium]|nr:hypothetical protein [Oscillospiraceae bacterium]
MAKGFKAQIRRDLEKVFHNADEHADMVDVEYSGKCYKIPVVIDSEGARERKRAAKDNAQGIFTADLTVYINYADMKTMPRKEHRIKISGKQYNIVKSAFDAGSITLDLEDLEE